MRRWIVLPAAALVLTICGADTGHAEARPAAREQKIAILLGSSGPSDKGFTDAALAGLDAARKGGRLSVGFLYAAPSRSASTRHPNTRFLLLDAEVAGVTNVKSVTFRADEGSFLAG